MTTYITPDLKRRGLVPVGLLKVGDTYDFALSDHPAIVITSRKQQYDALTYAQRGDDTVIRLVGVDADLTTYTRSFTLDVMVQRLPECCCAHNLDGTDTTIMCPLHADQDPCLTVSRVTGKRRKGTNQRGVCTHCGYAEGGFPYDSYDYDWRG